MLRDVHFIFTFGMDKVLPFPFAMYSEVYNKNPNIWKWDIDVEFFF